MTHHAAGLHVRYEKAGLILDALPVPQNADAVIIEANVRLPATAPREKQDFSLQWADGAQRHPPELLLNDATKRFLRVLFRLDTPTASTRATVCWREHELGDIEVPVIQIGPLVESFSLDMPTVHASLGGRNIAGRTFVSGQVKNLVASAIVRGQTMLAAAHDWGFCLLVRNARGEDIGTATI